MMSLREYKKIYTDFKQIKIFSATLIMRKYKLTYSESIEIIKKLSKYAYRYDKNEEGNIIRIFCKE